MRYPDAESRGDGSELAPPLEAVAVPIRLSADGRFETADPVDSLCGLIRIMFATSERAWPHAPWFGLFEKVSDPKPWGMDIKEALDRALEQLGVSWVRVKQVHDPELSSSGERVFRMEFETVDGHEIDLREVRTG